MQEWDAISASIAGAVSDYSSGNVRSLGEATRDMAISMITGAITGAIGAALPQLNWFADGLIDGTIDAVSGIMTRGMYALTDSNMSADERLAYVFDWQQIGVDFVTGVTINFAFKGVSKLRETRQAKTVTASGNGSVAIEDGSDVSFTWKLRGEDVTLKDVKVQDISYVKRSSDELQILRSEFNTTTRKSFLEDLGQNADYLRNAGFSETDILKIQNGRVPNGWQVHHKLPLDDSGTNSIDNLVLIQNEPYHKVITNYQNSVARQMEIGDVQIVQWPTPNGNIYPAQH